jgi:hypothetical protein
MKENSNDFPLAIAFTPILKTREKIQVIVDFVLRCDGAFSLLQFVLDTDGATKKVQQQIQAAGESKINQWALQFSSAEAALEPSAYGSVAGELSRIRSSTCAVVSVSARSIIPLTERIPPPPPVPVLPPPPPPPKPRPTMAERLIDQLLESVKTVSEFNRIKEKTKKDYPDLWANPELRERIENRFDVTLNGLLGEPGGL